VRRKAGRRSLTVEEIGLIMSEDPDDRDIRVAHGFTREDDWEDLSLLCRNGCGKSYYVIAVGKVRACPGAEPE
jgi:hypothetical protein